MSEDASLAFEEYSFETTFHNRRYQGGTPEPPSRDTKASRRYHNNRKRTDALSDIHVYDMQEDEQQRQKKNKLQSPRASMPRSQSKEELQKVVKIKKTSQHDAAVPFVADGVSSELARSDNIDQLVNSIEQLPIGQSIKTDSDENPYEQAGEEHLTLPVARK